MLRRTYWLLVLGVIFLSACNGEPISVTTTPGPSSAPPTGATAGNVPATAPLTFTPTSRARNLRELTWVNYSNEEMEFFIKIPSTINREKVFLVEQENKLPFGAEEFLLASNDPDAFFQDIRPKEQYRVLIYREEAKGISFDQWSVAMSRHVGTGQLTLTQVGICEAYLISPSEPAPPYRWSMGLWVDTGKYYYGVVALAKGNHAELSSLVKSFVPNRCKK